MAAIGVVGLGAATLGGLLSPPSAWADLSPPQFTWTQTGIPARGGASMAFDGATGTAVLFGGYPGYGDTWTWDGSTWTPQTPFDSPSPRTDAAMAYDGSNVVLFGGGLDPGDNDFTDTWTWDGTDWTQEFPADSPPPSAHEMAYDPATGNVVLFGGIDPDTGNPIGTWSWNGNDWTKLDPVHSPPPQVGAAMAYDTASGKLVLFGRSTEDNDPTCSPPSSQIYCALTWTWNGTDWHHETPDHSPLARGAAGMAYDPDNGVVLFGGCCKTSNGDSYAYDETWAWDGSDWSKLSPDHSPTRRGDEAMAYDPLSQQIILFGGQDGSIVNDRRTSSGLEAGEWWTWNGSDWTEQSPGTNPQIRTEASLAYDQAARNVVLFGGAFSNDTWTWDGAVWTQHKPTGSPSARSAAAMAYDSNHQRVVLFGGHNSDHPGGLDDTWTWDGSDWTQKSPHHSPPKRTAAAFAYDPATGTAVLFGGCCKLLGDTWTWDGSDWTHEDPKHNPPARSFASMAYDSAGRQVVLFGGGGDDTWTWNGSDWHRESPSNSPAARDGATMAFDPAGGNAVLFGGEDKHANAFGDTWEWDGTDWTQVFPANSPTARYYAAMAFDSNGNLVLFGGTDGPDAVSSVYAPKPDVVRVVGKRGGTVATTNALSASNPISTSVKVGHTKAGGMVSIAQTTKTAKAPAGYTFLNAQVAVAAPRGSAGSPLRLTFTLDSSLVAGAPGIDVFRSERSKPVEVGPCARVSPPNPNPCVSSETTTPTGAVRITVLTSSASTWNFATLGFSRSLTIAYKHKKGIFTGKLSSFESACVAGEKVTVFRKKSGPDRKIGADKASSTGVYKLRDPNPKGKYYTSVPQHEEPLVGICEAAESKTLRP
jgi:hypothetical protein